MVVLFVISLVAAICVVVVVVGAYLTWKYWKLKHMTSPKEYSPSSNTASPSYWPVSNPFSWSKKDPALTNVQISQSTPDLRADEVPGSPTILHQEEPIGKTHYKTVIKQSTMPAMSTRHLTFHRQLSHKLDLSNVEFTIHSVKYKEQPSASCQLRPELYHQELHEARASAGPLTNENAKKCGKLHFTLRYCHVTDCLVVRVVSAENLPAKDFSGTSDPYVKMYLLPDRKNKFQTKVHRKTLEPEFNEEFRFSVAYNSLPERVLQFSIYDFDRFSRHDLIGVVLVREVAIEKLASQEIAYCKDIIGVQHVSTAFICIPASTSLQCKVIYTFWFPMSLSA